MSDTLKPAPTTDGLGVIASLMEVLSRAYAAGQHFTSRLEAGEHNHDDGGFRFTLTVHPLPDGKPQYRPLRLVM